MSRRSAVAAVFGIGLAAAAAGGARDRAGPDSSGRVRFDHRRHAAYAPDCSACHRYARADAAPGAEGPAPRFDRPVEADCSACHRFDCAARGSDPEEPDAPACAMCHPVDARGRVALPMVAPVPRRLAFDHRAHDAASGAGCVACHDPAQADSGGPPSMRVCMSCHRDPAAEGCARCHLADARGLLRTAGPGGRALVPPAWMGELAHGAGFDRTHGDVARSQRAVCARCHEESACQECHIGTATGRRFHGAGWMSAHGPAGRTADLRCGVCHRGQETCLACHRRSGATWDSPEIGRSVPRGSSFHDEAWRGIHGRDARANLASCVSCHSARDCTTCHATGPSPHGPGFGARCSALADLSPGLCLPCHATAPECR